MSDLFGGLFSGSLDDIPTEGADYERPNDGVYEATVTDIYTMEGTKNYPERKWVLIDYTLDETGTTVSDWFQMPDDPANPTDKERQKLRYYVNRLGDLGVERNNINTVKMDDLIDLRVVVTLRTKGQYQNITQVDLLPDDVMPQQQVQATSAPTSQVVGQAPVPAGRRTARQNPFSGATA